MQASSAVDWDAVDTVLLDMDGTLLDLRFDNWFWQTFIPIRYAEANGISEAQAIDRTHRIGQTERVFAYRLIAKYTVEEKVLVPLDPPVPVVMVVPPVPRSWACARADANNARAATTEAANIRDLSQARNIIGFSSGTYDASAMQGGCLMTGAGPRYRPGG